MEAEVRALIDRQAIVDVVNHSAIALDQQDWDLMASCFASDVDWDSDVVDADAGYAGLEAQAKKHLSGVKAALHMVSTHQVTIDDERATCRSYVHVSIVPGGGQRDELTVGGIYDDTLVRTGGRWLIARRRFTTSWSTGSLGVTE